MGYMKKVNVMGMELDEWSYLSCIAHVASEKEWATIYDIQSSEHGKGHATELLKEMKNYYKDKKFGGSIALNERMRGLYKKLGIEEYD